MDRQNVPSVVCPERSSPLAGRELQAGVANGKNVLERVCAMLTKFGTPDIRRRRDERLFAVQSEATEFTSAGFHLPPGNVTA